MQKRWRRQFHLQQPGISHWSWHYAIKNATFVHVPRLGIILSRISQGKKHYSIYIIPMLSWIWKQGVISGKTGFTGNAGYCYVCAVRQDERLFIIASWMRMAESKNYKWSDTKNSSFPMAGKIISIWCCRSFHNCLGIPVTESSTEEKGVHIRTKSDRSDILPNRLCWKIHAYFLKKIERKDIFWKNRNRSHGETGASG